MKNKVIVYVFVAACVIGALALAMPVSGSETQRGTTSPDPKLTGTNTTEDKTFWGYIAIGAGIAIGLTGLATSIAQQAIGAAAVGAMAEDPKFFGKGLILVAIPETIVIFGLVIAILLWLKMG